VCQQVQISRTVAEAIRQTAEQLISARAATRDERMAALDEEQASLSGLEMKLTDAFTQGDIESEAYRERSVQLRNRRLAIERLVGRPPVPEEEMKARIRETLELATSMWDVYEPLDDNRRNELVRAVFRTLVLGPEGIIGWSLNPPFDRLQKSTKSDVQTIAATMLDGLDAA
jgi:hypothetical protein